MNVDIDILEKATKIVFSHIRDTTGSMTELDKDFYWHIDKSQKYNPYSEPNLLTLGQLTDNWQEIEKIASGVKEPIGYALVWISALCNYLGEKSPS